MDRLPIDAVLSDVASAYARRGAVVVEASPGAGKTTRVPAALAGEDRRVVVLEPRRLAARLAAQRVADERGERVGETVGHQVRFDVKRSARTRILFMTEAVLTRRITGDPSLGGVDTVIVDEVHERHLHTDLALALVDRLRRTSRPDLGLVIMSATVDGARVAERYDAELVRCELAMHAVTIEHQAQPSREPLAVEVAAAVRRLCREGLDGHVLVFLPGVREIRDAAERCRGVAERYDLAVLPLHGRLTPAEQDRAVAPSGRTKVILATNVAESSITIDGIAAVIDSGLARVPRWHAKASAPSLETRPISQASATQRAGRAGRTRAGRCLRLYTERDLARAPAFDVPEIERADLAELVLAAHMAGADTGELAWLSPPPAASLASARRLLTELGAIDGGGVTDLGRRMAGLPVHPRWARALVAAEARGVGELVAQIAAVAVEGGGSRIDVWRAVEALDRSHRALRTRRQLARMLRKADPPDDVDAAVGAAVLAGFRDRVAKRAGDGELALADGGRARLRDKTAVGGDGFTVVLDAMAHDASPPEVRLALPIRSDWILEALFDEIVDERALELNEALGRVEQIERMRFRSLTLDESRRVASPSEATARILAAAAWERGLGRGDDVERLRARLAWAASQDEAVPLDDATIRRCLFELSLSTTSLAELSGPGLAQAIFGGLEAKTRKALAHIAPERLRMQNGVELAVVYPPDRLAYVESYMQDFFGLAEGPRLGSEPLVVHLWAPNRRAEQVTRDLAGFWREHYPALFKRLSRRYPKHHWPERPREARAVRLKSRL